MVKMLLVLITCLAFFPKNQASNVFFEAFPKEIKTNLTASVSMMCRVSDNVQTRASSSAVDVSHISSIFISRGDGDDVASVTVFDSPTALADLGNLEVKGSLSALSGEGSLELSWKDPSNVTTGEYTCTMHAVDTKGHHVVLTSQLEMTAVTPSMTDLINNVNVKVEEQQQEITSLQQGNQQLMQDVTNLQQNNQQLKQNVTNLQQNNKQLQQNVTKLQQDNQQLKQDNQQLENKIKVCTKQVAFEARLSTSPTIAAGKTVVFDTTTLDDGHVYNNQTGVFVCPAAGVYIFHVEVMSDGTTSHDINLYMKLNSATVSTLWTGYNDEYEAASMSATLHLQAGDEVKVETAGVSSFYNWNSYSSKLSGHLIQADGCQ